MLNDAIRNFTLLWNVIIQVHQQDANPTMFPSKNSTLGHTIWMRGKCAITRVGNSRGWRELELVCDWRMRHYPVWLTWRGLSDNFNNGRLSHLLMSFLFRSILAKRPIAATDLGCTLYRNDAASRTALWARC